MLPISIFIGFVLSCWFIPQLLLKFCEWRKYNFWTTAQAVYLFGPLIIFIEFIIIITQLR